MAAKAMPTNGTADVPLMMLTTDVAIPDACCAVSCNNWKRAERACNSWFFFSAASFLACSSSSVLCSMSKLLDAPNSLARFSFSTASSCFSICLSKLSINLSFWAICTSRMALMLSKNEENALLAPLNRVSNWATSNFRDLAKLSLKVESRWAIGPKPKSPSGVFISNVTLASCWRSSCNCNSICARRRSSPAAVALNNAS